MKIAIVGSRDYPALERVRDYVQALPADTIVVSGGARGVDDVAISEARRRGLGMEVYYADWHKHGKGAGMMRNTEIVYRADKVVAFWDGYSKGTFDTIRKAQKYGKLELIIHPDGVEVGPEDL